MEEIFERTLQLFNRNQNRFHLEALTLWNDMLKGRNFVIEERHADFFFGKILPLLFHEDDSVKLAACRSLEKSMVHIKRFDYRSMDSYYTYCSVISEDMTLKIIHEVLIGNENWHLLWCNLFELVQQDVIKTLTLNAFLGVPDLAFRRDDLPPTVRIQAFTLWSKFIESNAAAGCLRVQTRVKLLVSPLRGVPLKNLLMVMEAFRCWWTLMNHVPTNVCVDPKLCLEPFLKFCFGQFFDYSPPLESGAALSVRRRQNCPELRLPAVIALISILGTSSPETLSLRDFNLMQNYKQQLNLPQVYANCKKLLIYSCVEATMFLAIEARPPELARNLWSNLYDVIRKSDEGSEESFELILIGFLKLLKLSNSNPKHGLQPMLGTVLEVISANPIFPFGTSRSSSEVLSKVVFNFLDILQMTDPNIISDQNLTKILIDFLMPNIRHKIGVKSFVSHICYEFVKISITRKNVERNCLVYKFMLSEICLKSAKGGAVITDFLNFGFGNHYSSMVTDRKVWLQNCKGMELPNQYLNALARELKTNSRGQPVSYINVELFDDLVSHIDLKFDIAETAPKDILNLYLYFYSRLKLTENGDRLIEVMTKFLTIIDKGFQVVLLKNELKKILNQFKRGVLVDTMAKKFLQDYIVELTSSSRKRNKDHHQKKIVKKRKSVKLRELKRIKGEYVFPLTRNGYKKLLESTK